MSVRYYMPVRNNLLLGSEMNIDSNSDGLVDSFSFDKNSAITGYENIFDEIEKCQKCTITTSISSGGCYFYQNIPTLPNKIFSMLFYGKITGNIRVSCQIDWYNGASYLSSNNGSLFMPSDYSEVSLLNVSAPANTTIAKAKLAVTIASAGLTGSAWLKKAMLVNENTAGIYLPSGIKNMNSYKSIKYVS